MTRGPLEWQFGYAEIADLCDVTPNAIAQAVRRENLVPDDLLSVATYLAAHGSEEVRLEIVTAFARMGNYRYAGRPKGEASRPAKKAKKKKKQRG